MIIANMYSALTVFFTTHSTIVASVLKIASLNDLIIVCAYIFGICFKTIQNPLFAMVDISCFRSSNLEYA
jgi:hypothetical protein